MASILTNTGAMTALQTLRGINKGMAQTQDQISTGKRVATAKDNASSFAISTIMKSDVAGFKAIGESLQLGNATLGVARQGAETVAELLTEMKSRIVAAQSENVDRTKIQADVESLRNQIIDTVNASQFNGTNLLKQGDGFNVLSSLNRSTGGVKSSDIAVDRLSLEVSGSANPFDTVGIKSDGSETVALTGSTYKGALANAGAAADEWNQAFITLSNTAASFGDDGGADPGVYNGAIKAGDTIAMKFGEVAVNYTVTEADLTVSGADANERAQLRASKVMGNIATQLTDAFAAAGLNVTATVGTDPAADGHELTITNNETLKTLDFSVSFGGGLSGLADMDVSTADGAKAALASIESLIQTATDAAASFGSAQKRVETQATFVSKLTDSLNTGIGAIVDADLEEVSARLQALQVQQQLGIQALSIANQAPQTILSLFR
ncbi:MAG: flagellin [Rubrimonas sp.]